MATALTRGFEGPVSLDGANVEQLTLASGGTPRTLIVWEATADVRIVVHPTATDGGALPSTGRGLVPTGSMPFEYDVSPFGFVGLYAATAATARVELR